jgi:methylenetetrahydrofolate reductase (NADPH)
LRIEKALEGSEGTRFSLEVFPPKARDDKGINIKERLTNIFETIENLAKHDPLFVSVTYNTEHLTKATSIPIAAMIKERFGIETVAHLTCINTPVSELERTFTVLEYFNIESVLALRGDRPPTCEVGPGCLSHASEMVSQIRKADRNLSVGVACYPEGHPESVDRNEVRDLDIDTAHFCEKAEAGADFAISQLFLDNKKFFSMMDRIRRCGVGVPVIPGIMPITGKGNLNMVRKLTGVAVPSDLERKILSSQDKAEAFEAGIEHAVRQCKGLMDKVPCIHFYTMDSWEATDRIIEELV